MPPALQAMRASGSRIPGIGWQLVGGRVSPFRQIFKDSSAFLAQSDRLLAYGHSSRHEKSLPMPVDPSRPISIQELDTNFQESVGGPAESHLRWVDGQSLTVEGVGWPHDSALFSRLADALTPKLKELLG